MQTKEMILQKYFGYSEFRSGQSELIEQILNGRPVVAVMPTGAGKKLMLSVTGVDAGGLDTGCFTVDFLDEGSGTQFSGTWCRSGLFEQRDE